MSRTALVTGGNRGIGLEVCHQLAAAGLRVVLTGRDPERAEAAAEPLRKRGLEMTSERLDVSSETSVAACVRRLAERGITVDVLINNAAIYPPGTLLGMEPEVLEEALAVNFLGPFRTCRAFVPGMMARGYGRVVNVSSGTGSLTEGIPGPAAYGLSKAALNALTVKLATEATGDVKVNAVCPGWVRTRMGGDAAPRSVAEGADTVVWLATLPPDGPSGGFFRNRMRIPW